MREYSLSRLYFAYIHGTRLKRLGVTAEDLASALESAGFIQILDGGRYIETQKRFEPKDKELFFKTIWSTRPKET